MLEPTEHCPDCGTPMTSSVAGMCPKCLLTEKRELEVGEVGEVEDVEQGRQFSIEYLRPLFPQLEIERLIASGGMGSVYLVTQKALNRSACLKILSPSLAGNAEFVARFRQEAEVIGKLNDPNIVTVFDASEVGDVLYILMEFVDGMNLKEFAQSNALTPETIAGLLRQVSSGLSVAHGRNIVHRDIKPANILIHADSGQATLSDFGLAKLEHTSPYDGLTSATVTLGTPRYMAPEQWESADAVDKRSDVYAVGVVFYELATGQLPVGHFALPSKLTEGAFSPAFDQLICRALSANPDERYQDAEELHKAALDLQQRGGNRRNLPVLVTVGLVAMLSLIVGGGFVWFSKKNDLPESRPSAAWAGTDPGIERPGDRQGWGRTTTARAAYFKTSVPRSSLGRSLAIDDDRIVAGAPQGGLKGSDIAGSGFVMIQRSSNDPTTLQMELEPSEPTKISGDADPGDLFGFEVAASSFDEIRYTIVGSPGRSTSFGETRAHSGRALIYSENRDGSWEKTADFSGGVHESVTPALFGHDVAAFGRTVVVGAPRYMATKESAIGAIGVYEYRSGGSWREQWIEKPNAGAPEGIREDDDPDFGFSVAINGNFLVAGSPRDSSANPQQGAVFVYERDERGLWVKQQRLVDPNGLPGEQFGFRLAIRDDWLLVTSYSSRIDGKSFPIGHVSVFRLGENVNDPWHFHQRLEVKPDELPDGLELERYGYGISVLGDFLAVSAPTTSQAGVAHHGIVFLYTLDRESGLWYPHTQILPNIGGSRFGCSVEFGKDFLAIGSIFFPPNGSSKSYRAGAVFCFDLKSFK